MSLITEMYENSSQTPLGQRRNGPDLAELAEDWLTVKNVGNRPDDRGKATEHAAAT